MHALAAGNNTGGTILGIFLYILAFAAYWTPSIIAVCRWNKIPNPAGVLITNFFAWFLLFPWVIALVMAVRSQPRPVQMQMPGYYPLPPSPGYYPQGPQS
jgi:hypothetical protein